MIRDPAEYKQSLMMKKDKWGDQTVQPQEVKSVIKQEPEPAPIE